MEVKPWQSLSNTEKVDFFLKCQQLLRDFHPNSDFIFREDNVAERMTHVSEVSKKYKGFCYSDDTICVLFNKIYITNINDPVEAIRANLHREPASNYNAATIDFVVFREMKDCLDFCRKYYEPKVQYVLYVKNNKPKIYKTEKLMSRALDIPIVS